MIFHDFPWFSMIFHDFLTSPYMSIHGAETKPTLHIKEPRAWPPSASRRTQPPRSPEGRLLRCKKWGRKPWETSETMGKSWKSMENIGKYMGNTLENHRKIIGKSWERMGAHRNRWENHGKVWHSKIRERKTWENLGKSWEDMRNHRKKYQSIIGKYRKNKENPRTIRES